MLACLVACNRNEPNQGRGRGREAQGALQVGGTKKKKKRKAGPRSLPVVTYASPHQVYLIRCTSTVTSGNTCLLVNSSSSAPEARLNDMKRVNSSSQLSPNGICSDFLKAWFHCMISRVQKWLAGLSTLLLSDCDQ